MNYECEAQCGQPVNQAEIYDDEKYIKFFDYNKNKFVVYHKEHYNQSPKVHE